VDEIDEDRDDDDDRPEGECERATRGEETGRGVPERAA